MFNSRVGSNGLKMLLISLLLIVCSVGLSLLWSLVWTLRAAARQSVEPAQPDVYVVPGKHLLANMPDAEFLQRLQRVSVLWQKMPKTIYLLGGKTSGNSITEAAAAQSVLLENGVAVINIRLEQRSQHTLENLQFVNHMVAEGQELALISNRYHLPRLGLMAAGLGMTAQLIAAEDVVELGPSTWRRWLMEAFYNHWYFVGRYFM